MEECGSTKWGLEVECFHRIKGLPLGSIVEIGSREFIGLTQKEIVRFELAQIIDYYPFHMTAIVAIRELNIVVGMTAANHEFWVFQVGDFRHPVKTGVTTEDATIFNMIYCRKSGVLVTYGESVKCWNFKFTPVSRMMSFAAPTVEISLRNVVFHQKSGILNPPMFEEHRERVIIDDGTGLLRRVPINGASPETVLNFQALNSTVAFHEGSMRYISSNKELGVVLWNEFGEVSKRFIPLGISAYLAIRFLDEEFVILLDANGALHILDVDTHKSFVAFQLGKKVNRVFVTYDPNIRVIACNDTGVYVLKAVLPWHLWMTTVSKPVSILRCPKVNEPARVFVACEDAHVILGSPINGNPLTDVTVMTTARIAAQFYDRGSITLPTLERDLILLALTDGKMPVFSTFSDPCQNVSSIDAKITAIGLGMFEDKQCYIFGTTTGHVLYYNYVTMEPVARCPTIPCLINGILYDHEAKCLILVVRDKIVQWSVVDENIVEQIMMVTTKVTMTLNGALIFGYNNGKIGSICVNNGRLSRHEWHGRKLHDDGITGLSRGSTFFVSSSLDATLRIWTNELTLVHEIVFPISIYSCAVLNGKRDIVVGTDTEVMVVSGSLAFGDEVDEEDRVYDNFDRRNDPLDVHVVVFPNVGVKSCATTTNTPTEEEPPKPKHKRKGEKARARGRMFALALKKHQDEQAALMQRDLQAADKPAEERGLSEAEKMQILKEMATLTNGAAARAEREVIQKDKLKARRKRAHRLIQESDRDDDYDCEYEDEYEDGEGGGGGDVGSEGGSGNTAVDVDKKEGSDSGYDDTGDYEEEDGDSDDANTSSGNDDQESVEQENESSHDDGSEDLAKRISDPNGVDVEESENGNRGQLNEDSGEESGSSDASDDDESDDKESDDESGSKYGSKLPDAEQESARKSFSEDALVCGDSASGHTEKVDEKKTSSPPPPKEKGRGKSGSNGVDGDDQKEGGKRGNKKSGHKTKTKTGAGDAGEGKTGKGNKGRKDGGVMKLKKDGGNARPKKPVHVNDRLTGAKRDPEATGASSAMQGKLPAKDGNARFSRTVLLPKAPGPNTQIFIKRTRRVPTPTRTVPTEISLFRRSVRPKTPPKRVIHQVAPPNIVVDQRMIQAMLASDNPEYIALAERLGAMMVPDQNTFFDFAVKWTGVVQPDRPRRTAAVKHGRGYVLARSAKESPAWQGESVYVPKLRGPVFSVREPMPSSQYTARSSDTASSKQISSRLPAVIGSARVRPIEPPNLLGFARKRAAGAVVKPAGRTKSLVVTGRTFGAHNPNRRAKQ